jgi:hypothetical protein
VAVVQKATAKVPADETGSAGDADVHGNGIRCE